MLASWLRRAAWAPVGGVCIGLGCGGAPVPAPPSRYPELHCHPGSFSVPDDRGRLATIPHQGSRATVLEFWVEWCKGCRRAVPHALARREALAADGIEVVLVGVVEQDRAIAGTRAVLESWGVRSPFLVDRGASVARSYGVTDMPAAVVLDRGGAIQWVSPRRHAGFEAAETAAKRAAAKPCGG